MKREFKFRAWYKPDIEMGKPMKFVQAYYDDQLWFIYEEDLKNKMKYAFEYPFESIFSDDDWIVEQFTGLVDINNVEIYEGDIFKGGEYKWGYVKYTDGEFTINLRGARIFTLNELCCDIDHPLPLVIGNRYSNQKLLDE
jgi:hypothetical protein